MDMLDKLNIIELIMWLTFVNVVIATLRDAMVRVRDYVGKIKDATETNFDNKIFKVVSGALVVIDILLIVVEEVLDIMNVAQKNYVKQSQQLKDVTPEKKEEEK